MITTMNGPMFPNGNNNETICDNEQFQTRVSNTLPFHHIVKRVLWNGTPAVALCHWKKVLLDQRPNC